MKLSDLWPPQDSEFQPPQGFGRQPHLPQKNGLSTRSIVLLSIFGIFVVIAGGCTLAVGFVAGEITGELEETVRSFEQDAETIEVAGVKTAGVSFDLLSRAAAEKTALQFTEEVRQYIGTEVTWVGQVKSVDEALFEEGEFEVRVDVVGGDDRLDTAVLSMSKEQALLIPKDSQIVFTGTISDIRNNFGLVVDVAPSKYTFQ